MLKSSRLIIIVAAIIIAIAAGMGLPQARTAIGQISNGSSSVEVVVTAIPGIVRNGGDYTPNYTSTLEINMLGELAEIRLDSSDKSTTSRHVIYGPEKDSYLVINSGTSIACGSCVGCGSTPSLIKITSTDDFPDAPQGAGIIAAYNFIGYRGINTCSHVTFGKPVTLILKYNPAELPDDVSSVFIARYNTGTSEWEPLPPDPDITSVFGEVTALINQFSTFAIVAETRQSGTLEPGVPSASEHSSAYFVASGLKINNSAGDTFAIKGGESVEISANIANNGGQSGEYRVVLKINGETESTRDITLAPGQSQEIVFHVSNLKPGTYTAQIDNLTAEFTVKRWTNYPLIAGIAIASGLFVWALLYFLRRRRRRST